NIHGALTSSNTTLMVITRPPIITDRSPDDRLALLGTNITLTVTATGPLPMTYQWQFNGTNIPGATDTSIGVSNFHVPNEGWYTVVVSNQFYGTSATMHLTAPDLPGALNARYLSWENRYFNRPSWYWQTALTHDGIAAARSGQLGLGQSASSLSTTVSGPGTLSFWWAMAGAWDFDTLTFSINGVPQTIRYADRSYSWEQQTFYLADGTQDLQWTLTSGSSVNHSSKSGVLDQLVYTAGPTVPIITTTPVDQNIPATGNATFTVTAAGTPPLGYQWLFNGANIAGATNTSLTLTGI